VNKQIKKVLKGTKGSSVAEMVIIVAVVLIVGAFVVIPQLRNFATTIMTALNNWWGGTGGMSTKIFLTN